MEKLVLTKKRAEILERLEIKSIDDLRTYYPFRYEENYLMNFKQFKVNEKVCFKARVINQAVNFRYGYNKSVGKFKVLLEEEVLSCTIYNRPWLKLNIEEEIIILGKYLDHKNVQVINYTQSDKEEKMVGIISYYNLKEGISQNDIKNIILKNQKILFDDVSELIPSFYIEKHHLIDKKSALRQIHFPSDINSLKKALAYLKYEEFLKFYSCLFLRKQAQIENFKEVKIFDVKKIESIINNLSFTLTNDQIKALNEILEDLKKPVTMYRLLQGDVGCGKTIVAMLALYANYLAGYQGVLMAPTEILAKQHLDSFKKLFKEEVKVLLLTSSSGNQERKKILSDLKSGDLDILIGTHTCFQESLEYYNLGLIIADEQHRFGVKQRRSLKNKSIYSDFLLMSATPIPRTLASAIYGDMDISNILEVPSDRKGCDTYYVAENSIKSIKDELFEVLKRNEQIYVICASINQSDMGLKDVLTLGESLKKLFVGYNVEVLHGKMDSLEKDDIIQKFYQNKIQILVSTTVVEVGINVKNASTMVIYDADRFGLSQLHQLRGRIQRGNIRGRLYILSKSKDVDTIKRFEVLCKSNNGFEISQEDLKLRGPGDILGTRQSGLPNLILGNLISDQKIIEEAKKDAKEIILESHKQDNKCFVEYINKFYLSKYQD